MSDAFTRARWSADWAAEKAAEFQHIKEAFYTPARFSFEERRREAQPEVKQLYACGPKGMPIAFFRLCAEALMHGKNAFDQAAWAANRLLEPEAHMGRGRYFPWARDEAHCRSRLQAGSEGFDSRLHDVFVSFGYFDWEAAPSFEQGLVRELSKIANRKHDVGISVAAHTTPPSQTVTGPGMVMFSLPEAWNIEKGEMLLAEWHETTTAPQPHGASEVKAVFAEQLNGVTVGVIRALEHYVSEGRKVIDALQAEVGSIAAN